MNNNDRQILIERFGVKAPNHEIIGCESFEVKEQFIDTLHFLKNEASSQFEMLFDLSAIDECERGGGLSVFYYLLSVKNKEFISIRTHIANDTIEVPTVVGLWPTRIGMSVKSMTCSIKFTDHPDLRRILTFDFWKGHPPRKSYPCRATLMDEPFDLEGSI